MTISCKNFIYVLDFTASESFHKLWFLFHVDTKHVFEFIESVHETERISHILNWLLHHHYWLLHYNRLLLHHYNWLLLHYYWLWLHHHWLWLHHNWLWLIHWLHLDLLVHSLISSYLLLSNILFLLILGQKFNYLFWNKNTFEIHSNKTIKNIIKK